jgi:pilus assembly protein Flp/PilA
MNRIISFLRNEEGATALEYGLIAALIAGVIIAAVTTLGQSVSTTFSSISTSMAGATGGTTP